MGKDDNSSLFGVSGGTIPAEIWREIMLKLRPFHMESEELVSLEVRRTMENFETVVGQIPKNSNLTDYTGKNFFEQIINAFTN